MAEEKEQETAQEQTSHSGAEMEEGAAPQSAASQESAESAPVKDEEREDISLSDVTDRTVPVSELRKVYKEMKKWKEIIVGDDVAFARLGIKRKQREPDVVAQVERPADEVAINWKQCRVIQISVG